MLFFVCLFFYRILEHGRLRRDAQAPEHTESVAVDEIPNQNLDHQSRWVRQHRCLLMIRGFCANALVQLIYVCDLGINQCAQLICLI